MTRRIAAATKAAQEAQRTGNAVEAAALAHDHTTITVGTMSVADVIAREAKRLNERAFELMNEEDETP